MRSPSLASNNLFIYLIDRNISSLIYTPKKWLQQWSLIIICYSFQKKKNLDNFFDDKGSRCSRGVCVWSIKKVSPVMRWGGVHCPLSWERGFAPSRPPGHGDKRPSSLLRAPIPPWRQWGPSETFCVVTFAMFST